MKKIFLLTILLSSLAIAQTNISVHNIKATGNVTATGTVTGSNIPANIPGIGTCVNQFVRVLNNGAPPTCATVGTSDLAASLALVTPSIDVASGISLNLSGNLTFGSSTNNLSAFSATTSAQLRGVLSDESGTGAALFAGGNIGVATATSVNGLTITSSTGTLTIANGKTLTANNSVAISGTDGTTMTFPATSATIARTDAGQTFTGVQVMASPTISGTIAGSATYSTPTLSSPVISSGISSGTGLDRIRVASCTTAASTNGNCVATITWNVTFANTSYTSTCTEDSPVTGNTFIVGTLNKSTTTMQYILQNVPGNSSASAATINCIAIHD